MDGNGEKIIQEEKETFIRISRVGGKIKFETNVADIITGYGLCEWAKTAVDAHMIRLQQAKKPLIKRIGGAFGGRG